MFAFLNFTNFHRKCFEKIFIFAFPYLILRQKDLIFSRIKIPQGIEIWHFVISDSISLNDFFVNKIRKKKTFISFFYFYSVYKMEQLSKFFFLTFEIAHAAENSTDTIKF